MNSEHAARPENSGRWDGDDIRNLYRFLLRREAESDATVERMRSLDGYVLVRNFFTSPEFVSLMDAALQQGERPWIYDMGPPPGQLIDWVARRFPLSKAGRKSIREAPAVWGRLYSTLLNDPQFQQTAGVDTPEWRRRCEALSRLAAVEGRIEAVEGRVLRGWALKLDQPAQPALIEVWSDGVFIGAAAADHFRRDIQDRFGGDGRAGFELRLPVDARDETLEREVEVRAGGVIIGRAAVSRREPVLDGMAAAARELAEIRKQVERLEARIPRIEAGAAQPLSDYSAYAAAWREMGADAPDSSSRSLVVVDAVGRPIRDLAQTVESLMAQTIAFEGLSVALVVEARQESVAEDLRNRCAWQGLTGVSVHVVDSSSPAARVMAAIELVGLRGDVCLAVVAGDDLAPGALRRINARLELRLDVQAVYFDEDCFEADDHEIDAAVRRRCAPVLKPGFDRDLLLQTPYVGRRVAVRMDALRDHGLDPEAGEDFAGELLLRLSDGDFAIDHIGRVLLSRWPALPASDWKRTVEAHLRSRDGVAVLEHADQLGARVEGAVRLRRAPVPATACIIIATKDGVDLLRPCVDSILERRSANATMHELLIIDHDSQDPETRNYLAALADADAARILPYQGEFNWALMNNLAAAETDADVLVFLNNDTVVLTPDWLDELVSQAQRPEVGVVGCRLLYADGTIQHAGFVAREETYSFLTHEGVGQPGSDPGYLGRHALLRACVAVTGACIAARAEIFRSLGGFDSASFPVEGNDVDLCLRAQADGLRVLYDPYATLYHLESKSRGFNHDPVRQTRAATASRLLWNRWGVCFNRDPAFNPHFDRLSRPFARLRPPPPYSG